MTDLQQNQYSSISSHEIQNKYKTACDLRDGIRQHFSWENNPKGDWTTNYAKPFKYDAQNPLAKITTIKPE